MKNRYNDNHFFEKYSADTQETKIDKIKTTNINVLLNRVKLNKKKRNSKNNTFIYSYNFKYLTSWNFNILESFI